MKLNIFGKRQKRKPFKMTITANDRYQVKSKIDEWLKANPNSKHRKTSGIYQGKNEQWHCDIF